MSGVSLPDDEVWTLDGDETSWTEWASARAGAGASPLVSELIAAHPAAGWAPASAWALDLGCGTGRAFASLARAGYRVVGFDATLQAVAIAQERTMREGWPAWLLQASAARLPLADGSITFLLAVGTLYHLNACELADALAEVRRVLQPYGRAVLHFLDVEDWRSTLAPRIDAAEAPAPGYRAIVTCFASSQAVRRWIEAAGLELLSLKLRTSASEAGELRNWLATCRRPDRERS
jgi:SAM-dependent methyltransferase